MVCPSNNAKIYVILVKKNDQVVVDYYRDFRRVCADWIWNPLHIPKLGGVWESCRDG